MPMRRLLPSALSRGILSRGSVRCCHGEREDARRQASAVARRVAELWRSLPCATDHHFSAEQTSQLWSECLSIESNFLAPWRARRRAKLSEGQRVVPPTPWSADRPVILMSACLAGRRVVYHGRTAPPLSPTQRRLPPADFMLHVLAARLQCVEVVSLCPEMDIMGLKCPRTPIRCVTRETPQPLSEASQPGMCNSSCVSGEPAFEIRDSFSWKDLTCSMRHGHKDRTTREQPALVDVTWHTTTNGKAPLAIKVKWPLSRIGMLPHGCVLKSRSPSCGVGDARFYHHPTPASGDEQQRFAHTSMKSKFQSCESFVEGHGAFIQMHLCHNGNDAHCGLPLTTEKLLKLAPIESESTPDKSADAVVVAQGMESFVELLLTRWALGTVP